jgi:probable phosphoglycerate mutase
MARHGETDWNRDQRFQGHADTPLNELGREQARELADALRGERLDAIYTSPLQRARETATIIGDRVGLDVEPLEGLREVDVGSWSGLTRMEVEQRFPDGYRRWLDLGQGWEDGESYQALGERVLATMTELAARHRGGRILIVTHGGPMRAAEAASRTVSYAAARRVAPPVGNCALLVFRLEDDALRRLDTSI